MLNAKRFDIEKSNNCENDYVLIEEYIYGIWIKIGKYCGQEAVKDIKTVSHSIRITFRTNERITGDGFKLRYDVGCGGTFTSNRGIIVSPNYPGLYAPNINCNYLIQTKTNDLIKLEMQDFDVEGDERCNFDSLTVYNGNNTESQKFGPYCGKGLSNIPHTFKHRGSLLLNFKSDYSTQKRGFKAKYSLLSCGQNFTQSSGEFESPNEDVNYRAKIFVFGSRILLSVFM
ncbi:cubilin-like protein [Leptotrombidium deliense]|uniref:Cubilin-like protein n=1 Tax=Leptotrombidium deliense TaxID=299467 RepID=A0A443RUK4_9ACAR|nr:cubilin-like protein [Leptotrombidium deliense]